MIIKKGAILSGLDLRMRTALKIADKIYRKYGQILTITSGLDGTHSCGSLHYYGLALDFRDRFFTDSDKVKVFNALSKELSSNYIVIQESTHIHIQWRF
jgi:hypothetical protein